MKTFANCLSCSVLNLLTMVNRRFLCDKLATTGRCYHCYVYSVVELVVQMLFLFYVVILLLAESENFMSTV